MNEKKLREALKKRGSSNTKYEVGYGKPPKETRFKKGQSGNRNGRPKGSRNRNTDADDRALNDMILAEAGRIVRIKENDKTVPYTVAQAAVRTLGVKAAKGETRAIKLFLQIAAKAEANEKKRFEETYLGLLKYKQHWEEVLEQRALTGREGREPPIHPDDIHFDIYNGEVSVRKPLNESAKERRAVLLKLLSDLEESIEESRKEYGNCTDGTQWQKLYARIHGAEKLVAFIKAQMVEAGLF